jgi:predicted solute-binding protein
MSDKPVRPQINIRLDKEPSLLDEIKKAASDRNTTVSEFLLDVIKTALGKTTTTTPTPAPFLETILAQIDNILDIKLDERLGELNGGC